MRNLQLPRIRARLLASKYGAVAGGWQKQHTWLVPAANHLSVAGTGTVEPRCARPPARRVASVEIRLLRGEVRDIR